MRAISLANARHRGFSMVELLVVIGIIVVLIAMLLPSLQRAREQANRVQCASNIRQVMMACQMYALAWHGWFPPAHCGSPNYIGGGISWPSAWG